MKVPSLAVIAACFVSLAAAGCSTAPKSSNERNLLKDDAQVTLGQFRRTDPAVNKALEKAAGYVVFPNIGKGGFIAGAAYGRGVVYENGNPVGFADVRQGSVGAQIGGQSYAELIAFQTKEALYKFKNNNFTLGANASAVALRAGGGASGEFNDGVAVFIMPQGGLMAEISIAGQQMTFVPLDVADAEPPATAPANK